MEQLIILQGITIDQLLTSIDNLIETRIKEHLIEFKKADKVVWLKRKDVSSMLHISLPTLHEWTKMGILKSYRINSRILYKSTEIEEALTNRKFR